MVQNVEMCRPFSKKAPPELTITFPDACIRHSASKEYLCFQAIGRVYSDVFTRKHAHDTNVWLSHHCPVYVCMCVKVAHLFKM